MGFNKFQSEFDDELSKSTYAVRKIAVRVTAIIVVLVFVIGFFCVRYTLTIGKWQKNAEREAFKESISYTEQAASFLAKSYKEYNNAENEAEKNAVIEYVVMRYPNLDIDSINNESLKKFYIMCIND